MKTLTLSALPKTWLIDIDGTLVRHNGYLHGKDELLGGVREFFASLPKDDIVILLTARTAQDLPALREFLAQNGVHYNQILTDLPVGERILLNDTKPSGLQTAFAINKRRDSEFQIKVKIDENL